MLIVIEGLDGAGKSTQVRLMKEYLSGVLPRLDYIHFPRYDEPVYGGLIGKFLRGGFGPNDSVHPQLVALLFAEDRHGAAPGIKQALAEGATVLLDRYVYSNIAYQCAKLRDMDEAEDLREWILNTEFGVFDLPRPDLSIFLDVPIGFVEQSLSRERGGSERGYLHGAHDIHEADIEFQKRVRAMYLRQASLDPSLVVVDCSAPDGSMLPPEEIFTKLRAVYEGIKA